MVVADIHKTAKIVSIDVDSMIGRRYPKRKLAPMDRRSHTRLISEFGVDKRISPPHSKLNLIVYLKTQSCLLLVTLGITFELHVLEVVQRPTPSLMATYLDAA